MVIKKDKIFKRKGADLYMEKVISLYEALSGFKFQFNHLDERPIVISTPPTKIIGNNETMCVEDLGMPFFGRSYKCGNLFIEFTVDFPKSLTKAQVKAFRTALHGPEEEIRCDNSIKIGRASCRERVSSPV